MSTPDTNNHSPEPETASSPAVTCCVSLVWHRGPANGGEGTEGNRDGIPWWWDGELLLVIVETTGGRHPYLTRVNADGDQLAFVDPETGDDDFGYTGDDIAWWAKMDGILPHNV